VHVSRVCERVDSEVAVIVVTDVSGGLGALGLSDVDGAGWRLGQLGGFLADLVAVGRGRRRGREGGVMLSWGPTSA